MFSDEAKQKQSSLGQQSLAKRKGLSTALLLASLAALAPLTVTAQQMTSTVRLSGKVSYARTSLPASGVHLLEDIFQRVRSAPQIAMAKNLYKQQMEVAQQQSGPTDYRLAIRPKKLSGRNSASSGPSLQQLPTETDSLAVAFGNGGGGGYGASSANQRMAADPIPQTFLGNRQFPIVAKESNNKPTSGFWESAAQVRDEKRESDGYNSTYHPPDLATATSRMFNLTKAIQEVQQMGAQGERQMQQQAAAPSRLRADQVAFRGNESKDADDFEERAFKKGVEANTLSRKQNAAKTDSATRPKPRVAQAPPNQSDMSAAGGSTNTAPGSPLVSGLAAGDRAEAGASVLSEDKMTKSKLAMLDIALLPPNVVTGIPLVRLGASEMQASSALHQIGNMKQQKLNKWTIWSWNRPQSKTATSMQLFMRNGLLDAMRIFDPSLIGCDFGVSLGDSLARVKEKFGEPAFILQEAGPGTGQNYIYPISQIGFQLARPAPGQQPRVVSVLIFNVK